MTVFQMGETEVWDHTVCKWQSQNWKPYYLGPDTSEGRARWPDPGHPAGASDFPCVWLRPRGHWNILPATHWETTLGLSFPFYEHQVLTSQSWSLGGTQYSTWEPVSSLGWGP